MKLSALEPYSNDPSSRLGRMSIDKVFHGDLEATSKGEMLTAMTASEGSAGYVAVERVSGNLDGRKGNFALIHLGLMGGGKSELRISVVPDSGTEELAGINGTITVKINNEKHSYEFDYSLSSYQK